MFSAIKEFFGYSDIFDTPMRPNVWQIQNRLLLEDRARYLVHTQRSHRERS